MENKEVNALDIVIDIKNTGRNLRELRIEHKYTQEDLRKVLRLASIRSIQYWESGRSLPSIDNLIVLTKIYNVHMDELIELKKE